MLAPAEVRAGLVRWVPEYAPAVSSPTPAPPLPERKAVATESPPASR
jgi:hypothetical protein